MQTPPPNYAHYYRAPQQGGALNPGPPQVTFDSISVAWKIISSDYGTWIAATMLMFVVSYALSFPSNYVANTIVLGSPFGVTFTPLCRRKLGVSFRRNHLRRLPLHRCDV